MSIPSEKINLVDLCRLCLERGTTLLPVFDLNDTTDALSMKISSCLPVQILRTDEFSQRVCVDCMVRVDSLYDFLSLTSQSQRQLKEWLSNNKKIDEENHKAFLDPQNTQAIESNEKTNCETFFEEVEDLEEDEDGSREEEELGEEDEGSVINKIIIEKNEVGEILEPMAFVLVDGGNQPGTSGVDKETDKKTTLFSWLRK